MSKIRLRPCFVATAMGQAIQIGVVLEAKQLYSLYLMYLIEIIKWRITKQFLDCLHGFATPEWKQDETG